MFSRVTIHGNLCPDSTLNHYQRSQFNVALSPGSKFDMPSWPGITIQRGFMIFGHNSTWNCDLSSLPNGRYSYHLIANMNSEITGDGSHIYSIEPLSKTGHCQGLCCGWSHLHGLTRFARTAVRELQNEKLLPTAALQLTTLGLPSYYRYR